MEHNISGFSQWNFHRVAIQVPIIFRLLLNCRKICASLVMNVRYGSVVLYTCSLGQKSGSFRVTSEFFPYELHHRTMFFLYNNLTPVRTGIFLCILTHDISSQITVYFFCLDQNLGNILKPFQIAYGKVCVYYCFISRVLRQDSFLFSRSIGSYAYKIQT